MSVRARMGTKYSLTVRLEVLVLVADLMFSSELVEVPLDELEVECEVRSATVKSTLCR